MLITTKGRYALRVLIDMAEHRSNDFITLKEIASRQEISEKYLESIVKLLVRDGVIIGLRGKGGGYKLGKAPEQIRVWDVLSLLEGSFAPVSCLEQEQGKCARMADCRTLSFWKGLYDVICDYLKQYTIADLSGSFQPGNDYVI